MPEWIYEFQAWLHVFSELHLNEVQTVVGATSFLSFLGGTFVGVIAMIVRYWLKIRNHKRHEQHSVVVFEAHILREKDNGSISLRVTSLDCKRRLADITMDALLDKLIEKEARKRKGFLRLLSTKAQRSMMLDLRTEIDGNDVGKTIARLMGRVNGEDIALMCPFTLPGNREAHMIRVILVNEKWLERLCDPEIINRVVAKDAMHQYRVAWLHMVALEWQKEQQKPWEERCMWLVSL